MTRFYRWFPRFMVVWSLGFMVFGIVNRLWWSVPVQALFASWFSGLVIKEVRHERRQANEDCADTGPGEGAGQDAGPAAGAVDSVSDPGIERTTQAEPLRGWKAASLKFANGRYLFGPLTGKAPYASEEARAQCENSYGSYSMSLLGRDYGPRPHFQGPVLDCSCGFYAWKDRANVKTQMGLAILEVDLYGTVIEHEHGYRAGKQRVLSAAVQSRCFYCSKDSDVVGLIGEGVPLVTASIYPLCIAHAAEARVIVERDELGSLLGTEVRWA